MTKLDSVTSIFCQSYWYYCMFITRDPIARGRHMPESSKIKSLRFPRTHGKPLMNPQSKFSIRNQKVYGGPTNYMEYIVKCDRMWTHQGLTSWLHKNATLAHCNLQSTVLIFFFFFFFVNNYKFNNSCKTR